MKTTEIPAASVLDVAEVVPTKTHFPLHTPISHNPATPVAEVCGIALGRYRQSSWSAWAT